MNVFSANCIQEADRFVMMWAAILHTYCHSTVVYHNAVKQLLILQVDIRNLELN